MISFVLCAELYTSKYHEIFFKNVFWKPIKNFFIVFQKYETICIKNLIKLNISQKIKKLNTEIKFYEKFMKNLKKS